jgi:hypothetical protein
MDKRFKVYFTDGSMKYVDFKELRYMLYYDLFIESIYDTETDKVIEPIELLPFLLCNCNVKEVQSC